MKKILLIVLIAVTTLLTGCSDNNKIELTENYNEIVEYETQPSYGTTEDFYILHFRVNNNNTIEIYGTFDEFVFNGEEDVRVTLDYIEGIVMNISEEEKLHMVDTLSKNRFMSLDKDLSTDSLDGSYRFLTVYDEQGNVLRCVGGLNPDNKKFSNIVNSIYELIPEEKRREAIANIFGTVIEAVEKAALPAEN